MYEVSVYLICSSYMGLSYEPIHHLLAVRCGEWMVKVLSSAFQVAVVSSPRTLEPWPSSV